MRLAIIGAGIAGLSAADRFVELGYSVDLFDKGRGPGGRMSTRRAKGRQEDLRFDHGAQYFTARNEVFRRRVADWFGAGCVAPWTGPFVSLSDQGVVTPLETEEVRYAGVPTMNEVIRAQAAPHGVSWRHHVTSIEQQQGSWYLHFKDAPKLGPYDGIIVAVPAEQARTLLLPIAPKLAREAGRVKSLPCWTVMVELEPDFVTGWVTGQPDNGPLSWISHDGSKPGRSSLSTWVLQAGPDWSARHLEDSPEDVTTALVAHFRQLTGAPEPVTSVAHRWRYARVDTRDLPGALWDEERQIGACGDWCEGPRVESAWLSGYRIAEYMESKKKVYDSTPG